MEKIEEWYQTISQYEKLSIIEAQELYKKITVTSDEILKKIYMDKLILGTLHVVYNHIKRNKLELFVSASYDIEDIISCFTAVWIKRINNRDLLKYNSYQPMITTSYYNEVCDMLCSKDVNLSEIFGSTEVVASGFEEFIGYKESGAEKTFEEYLYESITVIYKRRWSDSFCYEIAKLGSLYEKIYNNLNFDKNEDLEIKKSRIYNVLKLLICLGLTEPIKEDCSIKEDLESDIIKDLAQRDLIEEVDSIIINERRKNIIHLRFGLDDNNPRILEDIGKEYKLSRDRVRQIICKEIRRLRLNRSFRKKYEGEY